MSRCTTKRLVRWASSSTRRTPPASRRLKIRVLNILFGAPGCAWWGRGRCIAHRSQHAPTHPPSPPPPLRMKDRASKSKTPVSILTHAPPHGASVYDFVSYNDAATAMLDAVETTQYDNKRIAAITTEKEGAARTEL